jgi:hypothetical protein
VEQVRRWGQSHPAVKCGASFPGDIHYLVCIDYETTVWPITLHAQHIATLNSPYAMSTEEIYQRRGTKSAANQPRKLVCIDSELRRSESSLKKVGGELLRNPRKSLGESCWPRSEVIQFRIRTALYPVFFFYTRVMMGEYIGV